MSVISNHFNIDELVAMVQRLVNGGMAVMKAVVLVSNAYAVDEQRLYKYIISSK